MGRWRVAAAWVVVAALAGCAPQGVRPPATGASTPVDSALARSYDALASAGTPVFDVDPARSVVVIEVRRAGSLANLGHDHVMASHDVRGYAAPSEGRADVYFRADALAVDEPTLRRAAGFDTQPSDGDIAGTRRNMLTRVLHADEHPFVRARVTGARSAAGVQNLRPILTVNGVERATDARAAVVASAGEVRVIGETVILQTDFGIQPFSILGGALEVADAVTVKFDIVARKR